MRQLVIDDLVDVRCGGGTDLDFWKVFFPVFLQKPLPEIRFPESYTYDLVDYDEDQFRSDLEGLSDRQLLELFEMMRMTVNEWLWIGSIESYYLEYGRELADLLGVDLEKENQLL